MTFTIGICAPASRVAPEKIQAGAHWLEQNGCTVVIHPQTHETGSGSSAGSAQNRAKAFLDLMNNPSIDAVLCARGGNHTLEMLDLIAFDTLPRTKTVMGFSDITALQMALYKKAKISSVYGPTLHSFAAPETNEDTKQLWLNTLKGNIQRFKVDGQILQAGRAKGVLLGGNLSILAALCGTAYMPSFDNAILVLEDWHEEASRIDRMLQTLKMNGVFAQLQGVIVGDMTFADPTGTTPFVKTLPDMLREKINAVHVPVIVNAAFGHIANPIPLPLGRVVELQPGFIDIV